METLKDVIDELKERGTDGYDRTEQEQMLFVLAREIQRLWDAQNRTDGALTAIVRVAESPANDPPPSEKG